MCVCVCVCVCVHACARMYMTYCAIIKEGTGREVSQLEWLLDTLHLMVHYCDFIEAYFWEEKFSDFSSNSLLDET